MNSPTKFRPGKVRAIVDVFRNRLSRPAGSLRPVVKCWQLGDGASNDGPDVTPGEWTTAIFPVLRLDPSGSGGGFKTQSTSQSTLRLTITLGLAGDDPRDAFDFWEMVLAELYPGDRSLIAQLTPLGAHSYSVESPAFEPRRFPDGNGQVVTGTIAVPVEYCTKP